MAFTVVFMVLFILVTMGVPLSAFIGLVLFVFPRWRPLSLYAFAVYPSAYFVGLLCFSLTGMAGHILANHGNKPASFFGVAVYVVFGMLAWVAGGLGAIAGAFIGVVIASRLWWRVYASSDERTRLPDPHGWLSLRLIFQSMTSIIRKK
ncbi:MAG TPA: hypothetical protein VHA06_06475 [Candidatus Angelobacter sp.]|nr:hypothetical protein [Candidatus Angelobacter sp.]